ncbi:(Fe-S)-binding protein [Streptomyces sp. NPDC048275]|uniref:(Fe-S)-binding protein n=1 Tax=Streptomyces sp. NPDC048275 TaxID=3155629 RepID=UPI0033D1EE7D
MRVLQDTGFRIAVPAEPLCCGLTCISTGQLGIARRVLRRTLRSLRPRLEAGTPIVALESSGTLVFRADAPELMPEEKNLRRLAELTTPLTEVLLNRTPDDRQPPHLARAATVQPHWPPTRGPEVRRGHRAHAPGRDHLRRAGTVGRAVRRGVILPLRRLQSGHLGDYVTWLVVGMAVLFVVMAA